MPKHPPSNRAPHVHAAIGAVMQPKRPQGPSDRPIAAHVRAAVGKPLQAKVTGGAPGPKIATHVQKAIGGPIQAKGPGAGGMLASPPRPTPGPARRDVVQRAKDDLVPWHDVKRSLPHPEPGSSPKSVLGFAVAYTLRRDPAFLSRKEVLELRLVCKTTQKTLDGYVTGYNVEVSAFAWFRLTGEKKIYAHLTLELSACNLTSVVDLRAGTTVGEIDVGGEKLATTHELIPVSHETRSGFFREISERTAVTQAKKEIKRHTHYESLQFKITVHDFLMLCSHLERWNTRGRYCYFKEAQGKDSELVEYVRCMSPFEKLMEIMTGRTTTQLQPYDLLEEGHSFLERLPGKNYARGEI